MKETIVEDMTIYIGTLSKALKDASGIPREKIGMISGFSNTFYNDKTMEKFEVAYVKALKIRHWSKKWYYIGNFIKN